MSVHVASSPAEVYEAMFVPALFAHWGTVLSDLIALERGEEVLDVACGTGVLARTAAERVGDEDRAARTST